MRRKGGGIWIESKTGRVLLYVYPRLNQNIPVMTSKDGVRTIEPMRWGLIPSWSKDMKGGFSTFNARADGVDSKAHIQGRLESRPPLPCPGRRVLRMAQGWCCR